MEATAAICHAAFEALSNARPAVTSKNNVMKKLHKRLHGLTRESGQLLTR